jgi:hypothetical protein
LVFWAIALIGLAPGASQWDSTNRDEEGIVKRRHHLWILILVPVAVVLAGAGPALAQEEGGDDLVVLTGRAEVAEGDSVDTLVIFDGPATIDGTVQETVVSFNGPVDVSGTVKEDVVSFNGTVTVRSGAVIGGDLVTWTEPVVEEGGTVRGETRRAADLFREPFPFVGRLLSWLAVSVSLLILGLLLLLLTPRGADAVAEARRRATGPSVGWGLIFLVGLPIVAVLALVTLVGIPFGIWLLLALVLIYSVGYVAGAWLVGRLVIRGPGRRVVAFLAGLAIIRVLALVPILAGIVGLVAVVVGLGAVVVAAWRAGRPAPAAAV